MKKLAIYSSATELWGTPPRLFQALDRIYEFCLDAAANDQNALCDWYFTREKNALEQDWSSYGRVWLNPPYGREIVHWMKKAYLESKNGALVVCLVPARTDTRWWHDWVAGKARVTFLRGRLKFVDQFDDQSGTAPFPSAIVIYDPILDEVLNSDPGWRSLERKSFVPVLRFG
ncbi:MAG: phage N-6-adenine-methyltransferase [Pseudomonadota bacterium]